MAVEVTEGTQRKPTSQELAAREAVQALRTLGGAQLRKDSVIFRGKEIVLPEGSTIDSNIAFLQRMQLEGQETATWSRRFKHRPYDGLVALNRALNEAFGALHQAGSSHWLFGPQPPKMEEVATGIHDYEVVPGFGDYISVPAMPHVKFIAGGSEDAELGQVFCLYAEGKKMCGPEVEGLFNLVQSHLEERSIYKGQAINAGFEFIDLSKVRRDQVVYSERVMFELDRSVFGPIEFGDRLKEAGIDLKGAALLHGPFGTGKTLAAYLTGQVAVKNGWTFILCESQHDLFDALKAARQYAPAVVFYEDVDVITAEADAERVQQLLEAFDGIRRKGEPVQVVLTTNYPERIQKGLVRPGRIDAVIEVGKPDAYAVQRLIELNCPALSDKISEAEWVEITGAMEDYLPAFVVQAVKRAYMTALMRAEREGSEPKVVANDLRLAGESLQPQLTLMEGAIEPSPTDSVTLAVQNAVRPIVEEQLRENLHPKVLVQE